MSTASPHDAEPQDDAGSVADAGPLATGSASADLAALDEAMLERLREAAALFLWRAGAVRVDAASPFRLASGNFSPIYINCRQVIADPEFLRLYAAVASLVLDRRGAEFDAIAGGETAGIPYGTHLAAALAKPCLYVRKKSKGHGLAARVEGSLRAGQRVLLVEDLITDGGSKVTFLDAIREAGARVTEALVLFDRQQGGDELLAARGVRLHSVIDRETAFAVASRCGLLTASEHASVDEYFRDASAWHAARDLPYQAPSVAS